MPCMVHISYCCASAVSKFKVKRELELARVQRLRWAPKRSCRCELWSEPLTNLNDVRAVQQIERLSNHIELSVISDFEELQHAQIEHCRSWSHQAIARETKRP